MNKLICILITVFLLLGSAAEAQLNTISFHLPEYAGYDYVFVLERGAKRDTIADGTLDKQGKAVVTVPAQYTQYRGVGKLLFPGDKSALINMIVNNERAVKVTTPPVAFDLDSLVYSDSPENETINRFTTGQAKIFQQYMQVNNSLEMYQSIGDFRNALEKERQTIETQYAALSTEIAKNPLYAARIMEIIRYLTVAGSSFTLTPEQLQAEQDHFIVEQLNFNDLYTSGFWTTFIQAWYENNLTRDSALVQQSRAMLNRTMDVALNRELTQALINTFNRYGREDLLPEIISSVNIPLKGQRAPEIQTADGSFLPKNALILFYETGCGNCHYELEDLKKKYQLLTDNEVHVITIAADESQEVFEYTAAKLPWANKYCDFKGFEGPNFLNYGIVGTPTYILVDPEGIVRGRYAQLKEFIPN